MPNKWILFLSIQCLGNNIRLPKSVGTFFRYINLQVHKNAQSTNSIFKDTMLGYQPIAFLHSQKFIHTFGESTISICQTLLTLPSFPSKLKIHMVPNFRYKKETDVKKYSCVSSLVSGNFILEVQTSESLLWKIYPHKTKDSFPP